MYKGASSLRCHRSANGLNEKLIDRIGVKF